MSWWECPSRTSSGARHDRPSEVTSYRALGWNCRAGAVGLIMILAAGGATYEAIMAAGDDDRYPARGQCVDVGGSRLHIYCVGEGRPTVVLDTG